MTEPGEGGLGAGEERMTLVLSTVPEAESGERIILQLLQERLIACGNLIPGMRSLYRWEGSIERQEELLVVMKTGTTKVGRLFERVAELHPYTTPELVEVPVGEVARAYQRWVIESIKVSA